MRPTAELKARLDAILAVLRDATGAARVTFRVDLPERGIDCNDVAAMLAELVLTRSQYGDLRTSRFDAHCSPGCTMPYVLLKPSDARALMFSGVRCSS